MLIARHRVYLLLFALSSPVFAGTISIQTTSSVKIRGDVAVVTVQVKSSGNEGARLLTLQITAPGSTTTTESVDDLAPGQAYVFTSTHSIKGLHDGRYPLVVLARYVDINNYPLSALSLSSFVKGQPSVADISARLDNLIMMTQAKSVLHLKNLAEDRRTLNIHYRTPLELSIVEKPFTLPMAGRSETRVKLKVRNFSGLIASYYWIYAIVEYDQDGRHFTQIVPASVNIAHKSTFHKYFSDVAKVAMAGSVLLLLILARLIWEKRRPPQDLRDTKKSSKTK